MLAYQLVLVIYCFAESGVVIHLIVLHLLRFLRWVRYHFVVPVPLVRLLLTLGVQIDRWTVNLRRWVYLLDCIEVKTVFEHGLLLFSPLQAIVSVQGRAVNHSSICIPQLVESFDRWGAVFKAVLVRVVVKLAHDLVTSIWLLAFI